MMNCQMVRVQGRLLGAAEFQQIQRWIDTHPDWSRNRLVRWLCERWQWRTPKGVLKSFACRALLLSLARRHGLRWPPVRSACRPRRPFSPGAFAMDGPAPPTLEAPLPAVLPLHWVLAGHGLPERGRALAYLRAHHYLGLTRPVGSHLLYLVQDGGGRDLAVHLLGAPAWQCAPRDRYIGWNLAQRRTHLQQVANHSRFLILPWVRVPQLASHLLAGLRRRVARDWEAHHGHRLALLESFVEVPRYAGTAYRADHWQCLGLTQGRTRQDRSHRPAASRKTIWVYPLGAEFRRDLGVGQDGEERR